MTVLYRRSDHKFSNKSHPINRDMYGFDKDYVGDQHEITQKFNFLCKK